MSETSRFLYDGLAPQITEDELDGRLEVELISTARLLRQMPDAVPEEDDRDLAALRAERPRFRADCEGGPRPCPWVSCRHHLMLDIKPSTGAIRFNFSDLSEMSDTCALDVADQVSGIEGMLPLEEVGDKINVTRERVRMIFKGMADRIAGPLARFVQDDDDVK